MLEALSGLETLRAGLAGVVTASSSPEDAKTRFEQWATEHAESPELVERLYQPALQADLAGRLFVVEIEMGGDVPIQLADGETPPFLRTPFLEAIAEFVRRGTTEGGGLGIMTPEEFYSLADQYRTRAFTASRLMTDELVRQAYQQLVGSLEQGGTMEQFAAALGAGDVVVGRASKGYLETVFRTNVQGAYGAGRFRQITAITRDPDLAAARPFVEYRTAGDSRVRASHAALRGTVYRSDSEAWHRIAPPNGFNCRCGVVLRRAEDVDRSRLVDAPPADPDQGFDAPPAPELEE